MGCDFGPGVFTFMDEPGEHDPCYVVLPGGAMLPLNHHAGEGVDIARAKFIIAACNAALRAAPAGPLGGPSPALEDLCSDCPPVGYPTDETRCSPCPRRTVSDRALEAPKSLPTLPVEREALAQMIYRTIWGEVAARIPLVEITNDAASAPVYAVTDQIIALFQAALQASEARIAEVERERDCLIGAVGEHVTVRGEYFARAQIAEARLATVVQVGKRVINNTIEAKGPTELWGQGVIESLSGLRQALSELEGK